MIQWYVIVPRICLANLFLAIGCYGPLCVCMYVREGGREIRVCERDILKLIKIKSI